MSVQTAHARLPLERLLMERIVVVGASAGGVSALEKLTAGLPADFPAAVIVVLHLPVGYKSLLPGILSRAGPLAVSDAQDGMELRAGAIYIAVPDSHLIVTDKRLKVTRGPRENGFRPSVDVLFRSAAYEWGSRTIGVVLSGALYDGASGLWAIKQIGGIAVVQEPGDAAYDSMPVHALRRTDVDHTARAADMGALLGRLARTAAPRETSGAAQLRDALKADLDVAASESAFRRGIMKQKPSPYSCPTCHGVMFEIREGDRRRFRCHTGHGFTVGSLLPKLIESSEDSLWAAVRTVQEAVALLREAAHELEASGQVPAAHDMRAKADSADRKLELLRNLSLKEGGLADDAAGV